NRAVVIDGSEVIVGASIGSASALDDGSSPDPLLSKADIALYAAKADGRRVSRPFARGARPLLGPVSPAEFIPIVEEIGLMEEMGAAMLRRACMVCAGWPDDVCVSVNLSSTQFRSGNLESTIPL